MAKKVYILLKPKNINEALDFLTKENGIYQHDFMERHGKNDVCFICGESSKNHINYEPEKKSILDSIRDSLSHSKNGIESDLISFSKNKDSILIIDDDKKENENEIKNDNRTFYYAREEVFCDLCFEELSKEEKEKNFILCKHMFCSDCYLNYFQDKIKNNKVGKITCMQHKCEVEFDDEFIISHLFFIDQIKRFKYLSSTYYLLNNLVYTKYFINEGVFSNNFQDYKLFGTIGKDKYISNIKLELEKYRQSFTDIFSSFSRPTIKFSKEY